jgi:hypothetical protein
MATSSEEYRKRAQEWIRLIDHLPPHERSPAMEVAEAWLQLAADALRSELAPYGTRGPAVSPQQMH